MSEEIRRWNEDRAEGCQAAEEFERFFHMSADLACIASTDGFFRKLNQAFERTLGYTVDELLARPFIDFVHPDDVAATLAEVERLSRGITTLDFENRYRCRDGTYKWLTWTTQPAADGTLYAVARDTTERRRLEERLREKNAALENANASKDHYLAAVSHELRTPLNAILGFTGLLLMRLSGPLTAEQVDQLTTVQASARHLLSLINDLLDLAKIESGEVRLVFEVTDARIVVEEVAATLRPLAEAKGLTLEVELPRQTAELSTNRRALSQVLLNLTNNAIKFTERGSVRLELLPPSQDGPRQAEFRVVDSGVGIRVEDQAKIFGAFSQVGDGPHSHQGTGLGLHLSQKLAGLLGGRIAFSSEFGKGSTFVLTISEGGSGGGI